MATTAWMVTTGETKMAESKMAESKMAETKMADPKNLIFFLNFLLKRILKFCKRMWILERKLVYQPSKVWWVQDAPLRSYKAFKIQFP